MICVSRLKLNKFRLVSIPSNKDIFERVGQRVLPEMQDGQVAQFANGVMDEIDIAESQLIKDSQMPLSTK